MTSLSQVLSCSFAPDRTKLATASWDKTVRLWDPNTGLGPRACLRLLTSFANGSRPQASCFRPSADTTAACGRVSFIQLDTRQHCWRPEARTGQRASGTRGRGLCCADLKHADGSPVVSKVALTLSGGHVEAVYSVAWSNDGSLIATGSADKTVRATPPCMTLLMFVFLFPFSLCIVCSAGC